MKTNTGATVQQESQSIAKICLKKVAVQLNLDKNIWTLAEIIQCLTYDARSYSLKTIQGGVYIRNRRFIKPDLTAVEALILK